MAAIVLSVVFLFGYRAIRDFLNKGEQVAFITFKTDLEKAVRTIASDYGSVVIYDAQHPLRVPAGYKNVCFVDMSKDPGDCAGVSALVCDVWKTARDNSANDPLGAADSNVFLSPVSKIPIKVYKLSVDTNKNGDEDDLDKGFLCINVVSGRLDVRMEGRGDHTLISVS